MEKNKLKKIISEIHLYDNKMEALIKVVIWIISWIGGIFVLLEVENKEVLGSAYFIYMLSLLMEFAPQIQGKTQLGSKLPHTIFCFTMATVCLLSVCILLGASMPDSGYNVMKVLTIIVIVYMVTDTFALWLEPESSSVNVMDNNDDTGMNNQKSKFQECLLKGNLGNIGGGAGSNE